MKKLAADIKALIKSGHYALYRTKQSENILVIPEIKCSCCQQKGRIYTLTDEGDILNSFEYKELRRFEIVLPLSL